MAKSKQKKYKLKTYKAASKRFKMTGSGKVMRTPQGKSHLRRRTPKRTKAKLARVHEVTTPAEVKRIKRLVPYLSKYKQNPPG